MHHAISSEIRIIIFNLIFKTVNSLKPELLSIITLYADISLSSRVHHTIKMNLNIGNFTLNQIVGVKLLVG